MPGILKDKQTSFVTIESEYDARTRRHRVFVLTRKGAGVRRDGWSVDAEIAEANPNTTLSALCKFLQDRINRR